MNKSFSNVKIMEKSRLDQQRMFDEYVAKHGPIKLSPIEIRDDSITPKQYESPRAKTIRKIRAKGKDSMHFH